MQACCILHETLNTGVGFNRVELGVTKGMLLEALELTRTECLAVVAEVQEHLGALSRKAEKERSHSMSIRETEQLQWEKDVRDQDNVIQALTAHQAQCAALAEQWRAKHDLQVCPMPCQSLFAPFRACCNWHPPPCAAGRAERLHKPCSCRAA